MEYEWDEGKREANLIKHGVDFTEVYNFQREKAQIKADTRKNYSERRYTATGFIDARPHPLVFTFRQETTRIIGLRKANKREKMTYENKT